MSKQGDLKTGAGDQINRTQIARAIYNAAASMGISDRDRIDKITTQVIGRMERPPVLPGMEDFVPKNIKQPLQPASESDILAMVKEFLSDEKPSGIQYEQAPIEAPAGQVKEPRIVVEARLPEIKEMPESKRITESKSRSKKEMTAMPAKTKTGDVPAKLSENALRVLEKRYLKKDKQGKVIETPEEMFRRVAHTIASAESKHDPKADVKAWEDRFYSLMTSLEFLPNSPTLMNAGRDLGQLSACFVLPIEDSRL